MYNSLFIKELYCELRTVLFVLNLFFQRRFQILSSCTLVESSLLKTGSKTALQTDSFGTGLGVGFHAIFQAVWSRFPHIGFSLLAAF